MLVGHTVVRQDAATPTFGQSIFCALADSQYQARVMRREITASAHLGLLLDYVEQVGPNAYDNYEDWRLED
jgi:hypothetical protein